MTGMKKEDQPKVAVLSVALIGVIGFVGYRASSQIGQKPVRVVAQAKASQATTEMVAPEEYEEVGAFSELPAPNEPSPFREILLERRADKVKGSLPKPEALPGIGIGELAPMAVGNGLEIKPVTIPPIRLDGIVAGRRGSAIVTVGDSTDVLSVGSSIGDYTLLSINRRAASFGTKKTTFALEVGEEYKPPTPTPPKSMSLPNVAGLMQ